MARAPRRGGEAAGSNMFFTYILKSQKDGKYYIGSTQNIDKRIERHNAGYESSTKSRRQLDLVKMWSFRTTSEAMRKEYKLKSYKGGNQFLKELTSGNSSDG